MAIAEETKQKLFEKALTARETSYSPYSKFRVGAALLMSDGTIFQGKYSVPFQTVRAANSLYIQVAMLRMPRTSEGRKDFVALAVSTDQDDHISPCGICRQFLSEFLETSTPVYLLTKDGQSLDLTMGQLLPYSFGLEQGKKYIL
ncbi:hypothetical protein VTP01DRAFT_4275 [Rhizomucor pusillus]|uniref:uncharacterized protein n=1 Tax=Rhizomucor pusillus TaxID=4840 RepID=UPI00374271F6